MMAKLFHRQTSLHVLQLLLLQLLLLQRLHHTEPTTAGHQTDMHQFWLIGRHSSELHGTQLLQCEVQCELRSLH
jgi:hypothetical protein